MTAEEIVESLPKGMDKDELIAFLATVFTAYVPNGGEAQHVLSILIQILKEHYTEANGEGDCMCEKCIAERKRSAN